ncbi:zinc finger protein 91-like [Condylostylus longicornis]|uniref:zinc finger protein 91-like n=1 Tax=Condylostylus longicornis TaxID=2530218 RepID=UPI00244E52E8|nr:zinc finger protein 91-like [Condylostylus longicornis]
MYNIFKPKLPPNFELLELESVCRICLHCTSNLLPLFNNEIDSLVSEFLPEKLNKKPLHPHQICLKCFEEAKTAYVFKKQCEYSDKLIKSILNEADFDKTFEKQTQTDFTNFMFPCEKCDKKYEFLESLREHRTKEHQKTPNICRKCGKVFTKIVALRDHLGSAHPELGFPCNNKCHLCEKIFTRKDILKRHLLNIHNYEEKFQERENVQDNFCIKCQLCEKEFAQVSHLKEHLTIDHKTEQVVIEKDNMEVNEKTQQKNFNILKIDKYEFSCENCLQKYETEDDLKYHKCPTSFICEKPMETGSQNELHLINLSEDNDEINNAREFKYEDSLKSDDEDLSGKCKKNLLGKLNIEIKNETKTAQDIVKSMVIKSKNKIPRIKVKPNSNGKYECDVCKKDFTRSAHLTRHKLLHSGDPKPYSCTMCSKSFSRSDHLKNHVSGFHADLRPFKCVICHKAFTRNEHLKRHVSLLTCSTERKRRRRDKIFSCEICMRKFSTEKYVQDHMSIQHNETREFTCKYCKQKIIGATEYKKHCKGHYTAPTKQFLCSECGGSFTKLQYLMIHIRRHTGEKPYKCRYCDKAFPRTTDQYAHERSHTGEKNFHCTNCPKAFSTSYKLRVHMRIHTGERPYKCLYCPKAFAQNNDLKAHHRRHTGERFYCDVCGVGFVQMYVLRQHKRQAHGIDEPRNRNSLLENRDKQIPEEQIISDGVKESATFMLNIFKPKSHASFQPAELQNVCRICLHSTENFLSLYDNEIEFLISEFLPQKLCRRPLHPYRICVECFDEAKVAYIFKKQCEYADKLIKLVLHEPDINKTFEKETQTDFSKFIYPCEKCDKKFESLEIVREHRVKEHSNTPHECRICTKNFTKLGTLRDHLGSVHPELGFSCRNKCFLCTKSFTRKEHLRKHIVGIHKANKTLNIDERIRIEKEFLRGNDCQLCTESFNNKEDLRKHVISAHNSNEKFLSQYTFETNETLPENKYEITPDILNNLEILNDLKNELPLPFQPENIYIHICTYFHVYVYFFISLDQPPKPPEKIEITEPLNTKLEDDPPDEDPLMSFECVSVLDENPDLEEEYDEDEQDENEKQNKKENEKQSAKQAIKVTKELVKSMISESKKQIANIETKPNEDGKYECEICKKTFDKSADLINHKFSHSGVTKPYVCTMCSKSFLRPDNLKNHVNCVHAGIRPFKCSICQKSFTRNEHLQRHMNRLICLNEKKTRPYERLFPCEMCKSKFTTEKRAKDHMAMQHDETREFTCKTCSKKIIGTRAYKKHCRAHYTAPEREYLCSECGKSFTKYHCFTIHARMHTGERPYKCRYCGKAFPRSTDQHAHERLHRGEKNYVCTECSKAFATNYKLRIHMRIHTGERPYKCTYCPRGFAEKSDLTKHLRQHTGERFYCNLCDMSSAQKYLLRRHKREVHGVIEPGGRVFLMDKVETQEPEKQLEESNSKPEN